ncbi:hypothetical protein vseg_020386 [Gypsophila vaccaria]
MTTVNVFPFSLIFILAVLTPLRYAVITETRPDDIINQMCQECTLIMPSNFSCGFCTASLAAVPVSHVTNLAGLGLISLELALQNATNTLLTIDSMLRKNESTIVCVSCLELCMELYSDMVAVLEDSIGEYMSPDGGDLDEVYLWIGAVMQATAMCESGFDGKQLQSPLTEENYSLSQLCGMVLCIINLVGRALKSRS